MDYAQVEADFEIDGALREIHIPRASPAMWQQVFEHFGSVGRAVRFSLDSQPSELPADVQSIFGRHRPQAPLLSFYIGAVLFTTHFVDPEEIELIFEPKDLTSQAQLDTLVGFVAEIAAMTHRSVIVTHEGFPGPTIFHVEPDGSCAFNHPAAEA
jgi:hypothetical protein